MKMALAEELAGATLRQALVALSQRVGAPW
jgi:hypothetical protein